MSDPNVRLEAFRILRRVDEGGAFASILLEHRGGALRDPRDVSLLTEIVLGVLRRRRPLDHAIGKAAARRPEEIDPPVQNALRIGAYSLLFLDRVPDFAAVDTAVGLARDGGFAKAASFVNGVLRRVAREGPALLPPAPAHGDVESLALHHSHPTWWVRRLVDRRGWTEAEAILAADNEPAATTIAPAVPSDTALSTDLRAEGVETAPGRFAPGALRVIAGTPQRTAAFRAGRFWIQNEASQLAVALLGGRVGPRVLDACSAPGTKALGLAARLAPGGLVLASDRNVKRLARVRGNLARLAHTSVFPVAADATKPLPFVHAFDDVLVDAPCSGTGTLRRHPEIRWRLSAEDLRRFADRQLAMLAQAASSVRPGGRLVYSVCSVEPEEGEDVVARLLSARADFTRADPRSELAPAAHALVGVDLAMRTDPGVDGMDGFFAVLLTRRAP